MLNWYSDNNISRIEFSLKNVFITAKFYRMRYFQLNYIAIHLNDMLSAEKKVVH